MVKVQFLRLHNTVSHEGRSGRVVQLREDAVVLQYENGDLSGWIVENELTGLALTPQLLKQSGFSLANDGDGYHFVLNDEAVITVNPHIAGGYSVQLCVKGRWCGKPIGMLHELQNVYIDLTGEIMEMD